MSANSILLAAVTATAIESVSVPLDPFIISNNSVTRAVATASEAETASLGSTTSNPLTVASSNSQPISQNHQSTSPGSIVDMYATDMLSFIDKQKIDSDKQRELFVNHNKGRIVKFLNKFLRNNSDMNFTIIIRSNMLICIQNEVYRKYRVVYDFLSCPIGQPFFITDSDGCRSQLNLFQKKDFMYYGFSANDHTGNGYIAVDVVTIINEYFKNKNICNYQTEGRGYDGMIMHFYNKKQFFIDTMANPLLNIINEYVKWRCINSCSSRFDGNIVILKEGIVCISDKLLASFDFTKEENINLLISGNVRNISNYAASSTTGTNVFFYDNHLTNMKKYQNKPLYGDNTTTYAHELIESYFLKSKIDYHTKCCPGYIVVSFAKLI